MKKPWIKKTAAILAGSALGFAYYAFIGCTTGTCPISSNPYISTAYGGLIGLVLTWGSGKEKSR